MFLIQNPRESAVIARTLSPAVGGIERDVAISWSTATVAVPY